MGAVQKYFTYVMNITIKVPQKSSNSQKNPYSATGLSDSIITSPIEALLSIIKANFGKISQNDANFAARIGLGAAQKMSFLGGVS